MLWMDLQACETRMETTRGCTPSLWQVACQENDLGVLDSKFLVALTGPLQEHPARFECFVWEILETPVKTFFGHG